jgi:hypothetical protein
MARDRADHRRRRCWPRCRTCRRATGGSGAVLLLRLAAGPGGWCPGDTPLPRRRHAVHPGRGRPADPTMHDKILILDFGSQVTQLIARRVREAHVYCEIHPNDVSDDFIREPSAPRASSCRAATPAPTRSTTCARRGGVGRSACRCWASATACSRWRCSRAGRWRPAAPRIRLRRGARARPHAAARGHRGLRHARRPRHAEGVDEPRRQGHRAAAGFKLMASTPSCPIAGMADEDRGYYGVQFHPEVTHTVQGRAHARALRARHLRRAARLGDARPHRRGGGASASRWATKR